MELREAANKQQQTSNGFASHTIVRDDFAHHQAFGKKLAARAVAITIVFIGAYALFRLLRYAGVFDPVVVKNLVLSAGPWGPLALIGVITVTSFSITVPSSPFIVIGGILYGPLYGTLYALIGTLIGSSIAYWIARTFRTPIIRLVGSHAEILTRFQQKYVMIVLFVTRAVPVVSFEVMSYAAGLTSIGYGQYLLATLGAVGGIFIFTTLGSMGADIAFGAPSELTSIGLALMVIVMLFVIPIAIDHYNPFDWKEKLTGTPSTDTLVTRSTDKRSARMRKKP